MMYTVHLVEQMRRFAVLHLEMVDVWLFCNFGTPAENDIRLLGSKQGNSFFFRLYRGLSFISCHVS